MLVWGVLFAEVVSGEYEWNQLSQDMLRLTVLVIHLTCGISGQVFPRDAAFRPWTHRRPSYRYRHRLGKPVATIRANAGGPCVPSG